MAIRLLAGGAGGPRRHAWSGWDALADLEEWVWIDLDTPTEADLDDAANALGLNELGLEAVLDVEQLPMTEQYDDHVLVVLHGLTTQDERLDTAEVDCFIGTNFLLTVHGDESIAIGWLWAAVQEHPRLVAGPDDVLARLVDALGRRYLPLAAELDQRIDELSERALAADPIVLSEFEVLRRDQATIRRILGPQRAAIRDLEKLDAGLLGAPARARLSIGRSLHDQTYEAIISARTMLTDALDIYRGAAAERTASITTVLTIYAAIILPMTLIAGVFGMNHTNLPGVDRSWGFWAVIAAMVGLALVSWIAFARAGYVRGIRLPRTPLAIGRGLAHVAVLPITLPLKGVGALLSYPDRQREEGDRQ